MNFTIDAENNVTAFASPEEAATVSQTPFDSFASEQELVELAKPWPAERLITIWNSLPGVTPVKRFTDRNTAVGRIWNRIQSLSTPPAPVAEAKPESTPTPARRREAHRNPKAAKKAAGAKAASKGRKPAKSREAGAPRDGSKTAAVVALLARAKGATLGEIMPYASHCTSLG